MRTRVGEEVELIDGKGALAVGEVAKISDKEAIIEIGSIRKVDPLPFSISLVLGFMKPAHFEYAIEKATEVGVDKFLLFPGKLSEKKAISDQYFKRLETIVLSATKQCGRLFLPILVVKEKLIDCLPSDGVIFGDLESSTPLKSLSLLENTTLVIGPESGLSVDERKLLLEKRAKGALFHPNTLRAETAAVVGSALIFAIKKDQTSSV